MWVSQKKISIQFKNQSSWSAARGVPVPDNVMQSLEKLHDLSRKNRVDFADLCEYAVGTAGGDNTVVEMQKQDNTKKIEGQPVAENIDSQSKSANTESVQAKESTLSEPKADDTASGVVEDQPVVEIIDLQSKSANTESVQANVRVPLVSLKLMTLLLVQLKISR